MHINEKWFLKGRRGDAAALAECMGISKRLASLLAIRVFDGADAREGQTPVEAAAEFLNPDINLLYDETLMKDMDKALSALVSAAAADKKTLIIGDYDVDGIMGSIILYRVFRLSIRRVTHCIPHRIDDGYGINERIVREAHEDGVGLIVTCDNGISAHESIALAKSLGIDVIVTDHHDVSQEGSGGEPADLPEGMGDRPSAGSGVEPSDLPNGTSDGPQAGGGGAVYVGNATGGIPDGTVPAADAVIDPKQPGCAYPYKDLCGAMVAFKLAMAFAKRMGVDIPRGELDELLCYAAMATICDIVALTDENRRIVHHGLKILNAGIKNPGLTELIRVCGLSDKNLTTYEIGHIIGPCINAAGRLDSAELSYDLLTETDPDKIKKIAADILELNRTRQELTARAYEYAVTEIGDGRVHGDKIIVLYMPDTHESICGIVAGKLKDKYMRPVIVLTDTASGFLKGSGRSVEGYDLLNCVKSAIGLLVKYGGHKMAVGVMIDKHDLEALRDALNFSCDIDGEALTPKERIDLCLDPEDLSMDLIGDVARLEPFGRGNDRPVFALKDMALEYASIIGSRRNVVKMKLRRNTSPPVDAVFFGDIGMFLHKLDLADNGDAPLVYRGSPAVILDVTFYAEINDYNGIRKIQLIVRSVRKAASG